MYWVGSICMSKLLQQKIRARRAHLDTLQVYTIGQQQQGLARLVPVSCTNTTRLGKKRHRLDPKRPFSLALKYLLTCRIVAANDPPQTDKRYRPKAANGYRESP